MLAKDVEDAQPLGPSLLLRLRRPGFCPDCGRMCVPADRRRSQADRSQGFPCSQNLPRVPVVAALSCDFVKSAHLVPRPAMGKPID
jgi:hypothetical protein